jgi:hypothetical protein
MNMMRIFAIAAVCIGAGASTSAAVLEETNTYKTVERVGVDAGSYASTIVQVDPTDAPARSDDPHCLNGKLLGAIPTHRGSRCTHLCMTMPPNKTADMSSVVLLAGNSESQVSACSGFCSIGWSKWYEGPTWDASGTKVCATFKNWSHTLTRWAGIKVVYKKVD